MKWADREAEQLRQAIIAGVRGGPAQRIQRPRKAAKKAPPAQMPNDVMMAAINKVMADYTFYSPPQPYNQSIGGGMAANLANPYAARFSQPRQLAMQRNRYNVGDSVTVRTGKAIWTVSDMCTELTFSGAIVWYYRLVNSSGTVNQEAEDQLRLAKVGISVEKPKVVVDFNTVVIADEKRQQILEALEQINQGDLIFDKWGFGETIEKGKGVSMLFYGPPGTGKTLMAQAIASKLDKKLKVIAAADIESNMPGEAERNIRKAFEESKDDVLLFDECDSLVYSRQNVGPIMAAQVNELLSQLERFDGVTVFTTNRLGNLDEAVNRRLALKLAFDLPTHAERVEIWKRMFPKQCPLDEDVDWTRLAIVELSGGYIKNAVLRAARMAAAEKLEDDAKRIRMAHLIRAIELEAGAMVDFDDALEMEALRFGRAVGASSIVANGRPIDTRGREREGVRNG